MLSVSNLLMNRYLLREKLEEFVQIKLFKYLHRTERSDDLAENWALARAFYLLAKLDKEAGGEQCSESLESSRNHLNMAGMILTNSMAYLSDEEFERTQPARDRLVERALRYYKKLEEIKTNL